MPFNYFGKPRNLKFDINAIANVERELKTGLNSIMGERMGLDVLRVMLWAGLKHEDQSLTVEKIGNWIQKYIEDNKTNLLIAMDEFQNSILEALKASGMINTDDLQDENSKNAPKEIATETEA